MKGTYQLFKTSELINQTKNFPGKEFESLTVRDKKLFTETTNQKNHEKIMQLITLNGGTLKRMKQWEKFSQFR